ncbi:carbohydrate kinase family protein [Nonomuraea sp. NPDC050783]|uniref:carbohydrate kinase family protein n=1 Tax=Nonomuraea sp. NPDC050783 TaxID=3154634 RepID=UPI003467DD3E
MTRFDVLVVGGAGVDTLVRVDELTLPAGDSVEVPPIRDYVAHTGNGVALGLHTLGVRTTFLDYVGDDEQGRLIRDRYHAAGLDFTGLPAPAGTPRSVNLVDRKGRRFSFYDGRHPADLRMPADVAEPLVRDVRHVHLTRADHVRDLFPVARAAGRTVSTDLHTWDGEHPSAADYAYGSDLVFLSGELIHGREAEVTARIIDRGRARVVVVMDGARGCHVRLRGDDAPRHYPATPPSRPVVDSNGVGDAFVSAFLTAWLRDEPLAEAVFAGLVSGAFACGAHGTHEELIDAPGLAREKRLAATAVAGDPQ